MISVTDTQVPTLGPPRFKSPLDLSNIKGDGKGDFISEEARVRYRVSLNDPGDFENPACFERAGPREHIFFDPQQSKAAIVTCGGLSPGINNVIRSLSLQLYYHYNVREILGIRYGYQGFNPAKALPPIVLTPDVVANIHRRGGTILGTSRGPEDPAVIVNFLRQNKINLLFCVGGEGTQRGAHAISVEARNQGYPVAVIGIPKTIDNDVPFVYRTFGFSTALEKAKEVIDSAHEEAKGVLNGISLVKLMGRHAGYIAAGATLASQEVNFTLVPEVPFHLHGEKGFLPCLKKRMLLRHHAVIVVAEGAGQELVPTIRKKRDASGNVKLADIGSFLYEHITEYFAAEQVPITLRYFDPSYFIRSVPANSDDSLLCDQFARHAAHAAMSGKTDMLIGLWHNMYVVVNRKKQLSSEGDLWISVLASTGQPVTFISENGRST
jgi:6-phosphofructokinase 1